MKLGTHPIGEDPSSPTLKRGRRSRYEGLLGRENRIMQAGTQYERSPAYTCPTYNFPGP